MKDRKSTIWLAGGISLILWLMPGGAYATLPLVYFNTLMHEYCHALAALLTGGSVHQIAIFGDGGGITMTSGGIGIVIASAGYIGASILGAGMISSGRTTRSAKSALIAFVALTAIGLVLWVRNGIGVGVALFWMAALGACATLLKEDVLRFAVQFLGMQQCLHAVQSLFVLLKINAVAGIENDASLASRELGFPPLAYALGWTAFSLVLMGIALARSWSDSSSSKVE